MKEEWERKYRAALVERRPAHRSSRVEEAYEAIAGRLNEIGDSNGERTKLNHAIEVLNRLQSSPSGLRPS